MHGSVQFRTFFEKKVEFHRNSKNEVMRIPRMCSTHKTDFKTSNFYNKIPSRIQIRVAWCLSIYIKFVTFNVHITYNIYISCVYKTNLFMCIMIYFCWSMGIIKVAYTAVIHESISIIIKINFRYNNIYFMYSNSIT